MISHRLVPVTARVRSTLSSIFAIVLALAGTLDVSAHGGEAAQSKVFRAGAFAQDISPLKFPVSSNGSMQDKLADSVHDPLHARCLVLDDGMKQLAIVVCDSCMIPRELLDEAKRIASNATGIPVERMLISATHTHSAVTVTGVFQSEPDAEYQQFLVERIAQGIQRAHANLRPAKIGWGVAQDQTQVFNRRWKVKPGTVLADPFGKGTDRVKMNPGNLNAALLEPSGPVDPDVSILSLQSPQGKPIGLLANYSLHYVGGVPPLSADYFGEFARRMGELLGAENSDPPFVGIMSNGTSGDINNNNYGAPPRPRQQPFEQIRHVADSVARAAMDAYKQVKHRDWVSLAMAEREIELGVRLPSADDLVRAQELLSMAKGPPYQNQPEIYARETVLLAKYPPTVKVRLQAVRIGELGIVSSPCETFAAIGLEFKRRSPLKPTFTIELANGYNGYLPTPEQHALGGYETWRARSSYVEVDASTRITATLLELLSQVAKEQ